LFPHTGRAWIIGVTGNPGAGKSTLTDRLIAAFRARKNKVAVVAIDPTSPFSGGAILGDRIRMQAHATDPEVFIRSVATRGALGGLSRSAMDIVRILDAWGADVVIVETVGVGQSETTVAGMVDAFVLLQLPNAGDDLQAIKKGIVEIADLIVFNKADIDERAAAFARGQMRAELTMLRSNSPNWRPPVLTVSALAKRGIAEFWAEIERYRSVLSATGEFDEKRRRQAVDWMWSLIDSGLRRYFRAHPAVRSALPELVRDVAEGHTTPGAAASRLLAYLKH